VVVRTRTFRSEQETLVNLVAALRKVSLFERLNEEDLEKVAAVAREYRLGNGDPLFREGNIGDEAFVIIIGTVKLEKKSDTGSSEELSILGSGSFVGEVGLVTPDHRHAFTVTAMEKTVVVGFHQSDIDALAEEHPQVGCDVYKALSCGLARRLSLIADEAAHFKSVALHHH
jgi:CRP-like cAMP-binding protein